MHKPNLRKILTLHNAVQSYAYSLRNLHAGRGSCRQRGSVCRRMLYSGSGLAYSSYSELSHSTAFWTAPIIPLANRSEIRSYPASQATKRKIPSKQITVALGEPLLLLRQMLYSALQFQASPRTLCTQCLQPGRAAMPWRCGSRTTPRRNSRVQDLSNSVNFVGATHTF